MALAVKSSEQPTATTAAAATATNTATAVPAGAKQLFHNPYVTVFVDESTKIIRFVRSTSPFPDLGAPRQTYETIIAIFDGLQRQHYCLLTDIRAAPGRNDPAFETLMLDLRTRVQNGFYRRATLVATAVGTMQVRRLTKEDGIERLISTDESELLRYLTAAPSPGNGEAKLAAKSG